MKKIMLIIYNPSIESDVLKDRIKSLGPSYVFWDNHWLVETTYKAEEVYDKISVDGFEKKSIIILEVSNKISEGYWGIMDKSLWAWMKSR